MANKVYKDADGKVIHVKVDEVITDPNHELAVQIPPGADGTKEHPLDALTEPTPEDVFAEAADKPKAKPKDD